MNQLTENLRSKGEEKQSGPEMAISTDKVLMYIQVRPVVDSGYFSRGLQNK